MNRRFLIYVMLSVLSAAIVAMADDRFTVLDFDDDNNTEEIVSEDDDELIRENPEMQWGDDLLSDFDYSKYPFLDHSANEFNLNGSDWTELLRLFKNIDDEVVSIVHIGDSHIQGEGSTTRTRNLLQRRFGSAGRGLIIPFRLAGTNQPSGYSITSSSAFTSAKLVARKHDIPVGFTGVALRPHSQNFDFTLSVKPVDGVNEDFDFVKVFGHGDMPSVVSANSEGRTVGYDTKLDADTLSIFLHEPVSTISLNFHTPGRCDIYGFLVENWLQGVEYSAIGNNGAGYISYNEVGLIGRDIRSLSPDLVIISLGTNEAFGKMSDNDFYGTIDTMVKAIRKYNPDALVLLETPSECQRSVTVKTPVKKRNKKGRLRTTYKTSKSFHINNNIKRLRNVILKYGRDNGIATYDWYEAAGGDGSSEAWVNHKLLSRDRIHDTWDGYMLHGNMLYDALIKSIGNE